LYDITSSGLTHTWSEARNEPNRHRIGNLVVEKNFGLLEVSWRDNQPTVLVSIRGYNNQLYLQHEIRFP
jgi:alkaline phosphatase D